MNPVLGRAPCPGARTYGLAPALEVIAACSMLAAMDASSMLSRAVASASRPASPAPRSSCATILCLALLRTGFSGYMVCVSRARIAVMSDGRASWMWVRHPEQYQPMFQARCCHAVIQSWKAGMLVSWLPSWSPTGSGRQMNAPGAAAPHFQEYVLRPPSVHPSHRAV